MAECAVRACCKPTSSLEAEIDKRENSVDLVLDPEMPAPPSKKQTNGADDSHREETIDLPSHDAKAQDNSGVESILEQKLSNACNEFVQPPDADTPSESPLCCEILEAADASKLKKSVHRRKKMLAHEDEAHGNGHGAHGHGHSKPHSIVNAVISGFINYLLMFGLCCAYGMIMFSDDFNMKHRALGVKLNLCTSFMVGLILAWKSKVAVAIGGPDLNPVVFLGGFVNTMSEAIAENVGLEVPESNSRRLLEESPLEILRRLGGGSGGGSVDWCTPGGEHLSEHMSECEEYHAKLRATAIFATAITSGILGIIYFLLGRFKVTRLVSYVPTSVQEAFLSCIGYKVFKYALTFCNYKPLMFIPAACIGVTLYFFKSKHLGNPAIVIPAMVLSPLAVFYIIIFAAGLDIESMRTTGKSDNWMFPRLEHANFWELWTDSYGKADQIDFKAWVQTLPDLAIMIIVCVIDCLLKISSTESKLPVKVDKDYEASLYGMCNVLTTLSGSSVGYMQLKFNVINFGVLGNTTDRRGGVVYALLCGACFFGTIGHFNFLPRFFLGVLLFFAGAGFVAENLWGSRKHLSLLEWGEILVILAVFIFSGSLVAAVIIGGLVTCVSLILKYTKVSCIAGHPLQGGHITSSMERRNPLLMGQLSHIADSWFVVARLKGYIFFASAQKMTTKLMKIIEERKDMDEHRHLRWLILDCEMLDGMDASAGKSIRKLLSDCQSNGVKLLWSSASKQLKRDLLQKEMLASPDHAFSTLVEAVLYIEDIIHEYQKSLQKQWLEIDRMFRIQHNMARYEDEKDPWGAVLLKMTSRRGCPWQYCKNVTLQKCHTVLWSPGETDRGLFLIHTGKVALYTHIPDSSEGKWPSPVAIYGNGWFIHRDFILGKPTQHYAVAIEEGEAVCWTRHLWWKMFSERPAMANEIMKAVYTQQSVDMGSMKWLAELQVDDQDVELEEQLLAQDDEALSRASSHSAAHYSDIDRALLPPHLKELINRFEAAEAFGKFGAYDDDPSDPLSVLPPLPDSVAEDLDISFHTHSVPHHGMRVLPSEDAMPSLAYAGVPRTAVRYSMQKHFTHDEFLSLGHNASMARLSAPVVRKLRDTLAELMKKHNWRSRLQAHQVAIILKALFSASLDLDLVHSLMEDIPPATSDEDTLLSICSRLFQWHEQYWHLLSAIKKVADPSNDGNTSSISKEGLAKLMIEKSLVHAEGDEEELQKEAERQASELMWATDWPRRSATDMDWGKRLHIYDVALAVLAQVSVPHGNLHRPPLVPTGLRTSSKGSSKSSNSSGDAGKPKDMSKLIIHMPNLDESHAEFDHMSKKISLRSNDPDAFLSDDINGDEFDRQISPESKASTVSKSSLTSTNFGELTLRQKIHLTLEDPAFSKLANWISLIMGVMILVSIATMFIRPVIEHGREDNVTKEEKDVWRVFEFILTAIFTVEYFTRLCVADSMGTQTTIKFITTPANLCDFSAIIPFYVEEAFGGDAQELRLLRVIRLLRLTRIARIGRLANRSEIFPPVAMVLLVIWGIYMKTGLSDSK